MSSADATRTLPSSFRDPGSFVFIRDGVLYRQVNRAGAAGYDLLMGSGLYERLAAAGLLVRHEEVTSPVCDETLAHRVLRPERVPFVSYPYEWAFGQLKDAALLTLAVQRAAVAAGLSLKDASAFNVQFVGSRPVMIDTGSFEPLVPGRPWVAYRQFCQHFLAPLALMATRDLRLGRLSAEHLDGVPLDLASALLPARTRLRAGLLIHLHLHAWGQRAWSEAKARPARERQVSQTGALALLDSLERAVRRLSLPGGRSTWSAYYGETNYSAEAFAAKQSLVRGFLERARPASVRDLGANTGAFAALAAQAGAHAVALDFDALAVELHYRQLGKSGERRVLPLVMDLANPTPALGWNGAERLSLFERGPADLALALALVHHLAIANNVPLPAVAASFARMARWLVIEFVPKPDSQVQRMLSTREDVFPHYTREGFEAAFAGPFEPVAHEPIPGSERLLYLLRRREA
jgi:SAM-dependent methyltransferase